MSLLRKNTRSGYTHVSNELTDADGLSFRARGIALVLLSKPDDWEIKIAYLMRVGKEGKQAIRTAMQELAAYGFLMRDRVAGPDGKLTTVTYVADYPAYINVGTVARRINGYEPKRTDLPETDRSVSQTSESREVGKREVLIIPKKNTTEPPRHRRNNKNNSAPDTQPRSYRPPADIDPLQK